MLPSNTMNTLIQILFFIQSTVVFSQQGNDDNEDLLMMTNYNALRKEWQGFYLEKIYILDEGTKKWIRRVLYVALNVRYRISICCHWWQ